MDILLRTLRDGPGGIITSRDTALCAKEVTIGCAPDRQIQLLGRTVAPLHAVLRGNASQVSLKCFGGTRAIVNGEKVRRARLQSGDCIEIGRNRLTLVEPPSGFDLAIELHPNAAIDSRDFAATFGTDLHQTWLGKRWHAWLLLGLVALFGLGIPLQVARSRASSPPKVQEAATHLRTIALWSPGPLAAGHQRLLGDGCSSCHQGLFVTVKDELCRSCHTKVQDHIGPSHLNLAALEKSAAAPTQPCTSCHREHEEPTGHLVDRSDSVCVACHQSGSARSGSQPVTGFGSGRHPLFSARSSRRKEMPNAAPHAGATSGLKFSHALHLDEERVRRNSGTALACADCHKLSSDGERFDLPTMAANCVGCHDLNFDPDAPDRRLPHGKPAEVVALLQDYFARKLIAPAPARKPEPERRRLPGHEDDEPTAGGEPGCGGGSLYACAMQLAAREVEVEFAKRGCVSCHQVTDTHDKDLAKRFEVEPIRIQGDYFPAARFPHGSHVIQGGHTGDAACLTCHPANDPNARSPLLPELPACETCHTDAVTRDRIRVQCMSCHGYHPHP